MADRYPPWQVESHERLEPQHETLVNELENLTYIRNTAIRDLQALRKVDSSRQALSKAIDILSAKMIALKPVVDRWRRSLQSEADRAAGL